MTRTDNDTWDLASSVGATATLVAAARAAASREADPLIDDPFAEPLVRAVGVEFFTRLASGALPTPDDQAAMGVSRMIDSMAVRTKFFDEFFLAGAAGPATSGAGAAGPATSGAGAAGPGVRQAVILASGLDARAYRLDWPDGMVVFEIDQPEVIAFKTETLAGYGAAPGCERRAVAVDLRDDWAGALRAAGFDPQAPTAWSAEGLLGYLPPEAQDRLLDAITELSAPGSRVAIDCVPRSSQEKQDESRKRMEATAEHWRDQGLDLNFGDLVYLGDRNEPGAYLSSHGWQVGSASINELLSAGGRATFDEDEPMNQLYYISASYGGAR
ncbi:SAM-dependent methyltransferase [Mycolicibacterium sp. CH28]|uniref:class I SAM-dependent methyltransferase n=1 Tax=Mycolicibacterium sp. CH28 TaxID=2512237 RepID=UPI001080D3EE|nr:class I SAM-dependent methyltransferase [Mycolicibacterium sp. CH28]TGD85435.1 SAM-dependent methyltransferase [Mycolicibacterium sp. CH28]